MSNEGENQKRKKRVAQDNKQPNKSIKKITTKRKICNNKSKMSLVGKRESSQGSVVGKYGRRGQKRREPQKVEMQNKHKVSLQTSTCTVSVKKADN